MDLIRAAPLAMLLGLGGAICTAIVTVIAWHCCFHPCAARFLVRFGGSICLTLFLGLVLPGYLMAKELISLDSSWLLFGEALTLFGLCRHTSKATAVLESLRAPAASDTYTDYTDQSQSCVKWF